MTDEQLIELIEHKTPEELTAEEIEQIRRRLANSPGLRAALAERLEMERFLTDAIGGAGVDVSADRIIERARYAPALRENRFLSILGWAFCLSLVAFVGLVLSLAYLAPPPHGKRQQPLADARQSQTAPAASASATEGAVDGHRRIDQAEQKSPGNAKKSGETTAPSKVGDKPQPAVTEQPKVATADPLKAADPPQPTQQPMELAAKERQPWDLPLAEAAAQPTVFAVLNSQTPAPNHDELKRWLTPIPGQHLNIAERDVYGIRCAIFDGIGKLAAPLKPETVLRLSLLEHHRLHVHCFSGQEGVTFVFSEHGTPAWAAYRTQRKGADPKPERMELATSDEDRYWRTSPTPPVTIELRHADGLLTLSRGRVRLLDVPLATAPEEIYLEGHAIVRQFQVVRPGKHMPKKMAVDYAGPPPGAGKWKGELVAGADFKKHDDGSVELLSENSKQRPWVAVAHTRSTPGEIVLQIDSATPGTGIYLGDEHGAPRYQIALLKEQRTGGLILVPLAVGDLRFEHYLDVNQMPQPLVATKPWIKLVYGCGTLKCWLSSDGVHWSRPMEPNNNYQGPIETVGIFCQPGDPKRSIRLSKLAWRELPALAALASDAARTKAKPIATAPDMGAWLEAVIATQPADVDMGNWRRASALATLSKGASYQLGMPVLTALLEEAIESSRSAEEKIAVLDEAMLLAHLWDDPGQALRFASFYEEVGRQAYAAGERRPYSLIAEAQMTAPIWCRATYNFTPEELLRSEMLELVYTGQWQHVAQLAQQWRFYRRPPIGQQPQPGLIEWAQALAARELPRDASGDQVTVLSDWRHPLVAELSKEGFNVLAELEAALDGKSYQDACQIITTAAENEALGLLPDSKDPRLLTSLAGAVSLAMRDHPQLQQTMIDDYGPVGALRVRQAVAAGDASTIEAATLQFFGTPAAGEAHVWLGERALASGAFGQALAHFRQAQSTAAPAMQSRISAGLQIAAAINGQAIDAPVSDAVEFGETRLSTGDIATLIAELRKAHSVGSPSVSSPSQSIGDVPGPSGLEVQTKGRTEGEQGENPQHVPGEMNQFDVDWSARQTSITVSGSRVIYSNRFQVASYDLASGAWQWRFGLGGEQGQTHDWKLVSMRPVIAGDRIYVRRLHKQGPALSCIELASGKPIWSTAIEPDRLLVSDPLLMQNRLLAIFAARIENDFMLTLTGYDPATGVVSSQTPLLALRDNWMQHRHCQVVSHGDSLIVAAGGTIFCCDLEGQIRWVRRQTWVPANLDRSWVAQCQSPPIVLDNRLYVMQPGVRSLVCLEVDSGRLVWQRVLPDAQRIDTSGKQLIVRTRDGVLALSSESADVQWQTSIGRMLDGVLVAESGPLLIAAAKQVKGENNWLPQLVWLDRESGKELGRFSLDSLKHEQPKLGPLLVHEGKVWGFFGRGHQDPNREIIQLTPKADAPLIAAEHVTSWRHWTRHVEPALQSAAASVLPGWTLVNGRVDNATGLQAEWQGEKQLLSTLAAGGRPMNLVRDITVPQDGNPRLIIKVAGDPGGKWKLQVDAAGEKLLEQQMSQETTGGAWKEFSVDLAKYKGREICLVVRQIEEAGPQPYAKWKRLEIVK